MSGTYSYRRHLIPSFTCSRSFLFHFLRRHNSNVWCRILCTCSGYRCVRKYPMYGNAIEWKKRKNSNAVRVHSLEVNRKDTRSLRCGSTKKKSWIAKTDKIQNRIEEKSVIDPFYLSRTQNVIRIHSEFQRRKHQECAHRMYMYTML